jgi:cell pole-organizing protein PopZ
MTAAAREPTMEDILASIRKIVAQDSAQDARGETRSVAPGSSDIRAQPETRAPAVDRRAPSPDASGKPAPDSFAGFARAIAGGETAPERDRAAPPAPRWTAPRPPEPASRAADPQAAPKPAAQAGSLAGVLQSVRQSWPQSEPIRRERVDGAVAAPAARAAAAPRVDDPAATMKAALVSPSTEAAVSASLERLKKSVADDLDARVEAALRPMLREWLDEHLPKLVEKLVVAEIGRIAKKS